VIFGAIHEKFVKKLVKNVPKYGEISFERIKNFLNKEFGT